MIAEHPVKSDSCCLLESGVREDDNKREQFFIARFVHSMTIYVKGPFILATSGGLFVCFTFKHQLDLKSKPVTVGRKMNFQIIFRASNSCIFDRISSLSPHF